MVYPILFRMLGKGPHYYYVMFTIKMVKADVYLYFLFRSATHLLLQLLAFEVIAKCSARFVLEISFYDLSDHCRNNHFLEYFELRNLEY